MRRLHRDGNHQHRAARVLGDRPLHVQLTDELMVRAAEYTALMTHADARDGALTWARFTAWLGTRSAA